MRPPFDLRLTICSRAASAHETTLADTVDLAESSQAQKSHSEHVSMEQPKQWHTRSSARQGRLLSGIFSAGLVITGICVCLVYMLDLSFLAGAKGTKPTMSVDPTSVAAVDAPGAGHGAGFVSTDGEGVSSQPTEEDDNFSPVILHPEEHVRRPPRTIHLNWTVTQEWRAPDGVTKQVYLINGTVCAAFFFYNNSTVSDVYIGKFPGPVVEARSGDELVVNVYNGITNGSHPGISIHWHGLSMNGTQWALHVIIFTWQHANQKYSANYDRGQ